MRQLTALTDFAVRLREYRPKKVTLRDLLLANLIWSSMDMRRAREKLQKAGILRPGFFWAWPRWHIDLPKVQKILAEL